MTCTALSRPSTSQRRLDPSPGTRSTWLAWSSRARWSMAIGLDDTRAKAGTISASVEYRSYGRTGIRVSALALGCGGFGGVGSTPELFGQGEDQETAFALMDRAWEAGINYF